MRIVILTIGSRGDLQPCVAIGLGLQRAGHEVCIATTVDFEPFVRGWGLDFAPVGGKFETLVAQEEGQRWMTTGSSSLAFRRQVRRTPLPFGRPFLDDCWTACQGAQAILYGLIAYGAWHIAEKMGVPSACVHYHPFSLSHVSPNLFGPWRHRPSSFGSQQIQLLAQRISWRHLEPDLNAWRAETLELPPVPPAGPYEEAWRQRIPILYGYSQRVAPKPAAWPDWYHVTGFWFLDRPADWQPPADLAEFLAAGPPPVSIGFGSMTTGDPAALTGLAVEALRRAGQRGVLVGGLGGLVQSDLPDSVFLIKEVPYDWLFPRVAAVVHHGGAGTTAWGLRAGVPSIITPFFYDQPFWGERVAALGVGPPPIPLRRLSAERLAAAIRSATSNTEMRSRAAALGEQIRAEDGVAKAIEVFQARLNADG